MNSSACWICGAEADSREHILKHSDLRAHFPGSRRLYVYRNNKRPRFAQGTNDPLLKYGRTLCRACNSTLTQPHDRAWAALSDFLRSRERQLHAGDRIDLTGVFPFRTRRHLLWLHLYFVKLFGCLAVESGAPVDVPSMARAIRSGTAHPKVWLRFRPAVVLAEPFMVGRSRLETNMRDGRMVHAAWTYELGFVALDVVFLEPGENPKNLVGAWHPYQFRMVVPVIEAA